MTALVNYDKIKGLVIEQIKNVKEGNTCWNKLETIQIQLRLGNITHVLILNFIL